MNLSLFLVAVGFFPQLVLTNELELKKLLRGRRLTAARPATIEEFPFLVGLERNLHFCCGGAIISPKYIITAAHPFDSNKNPSSYQVRAGSSYAERGGDEHQVRHIIIHEKYDKNDTNVLCDLAILKLETAIKFDYKTKRSITMLNLGEEVKPDFIASTAGWGQPSEYWVHTDSLFAVELSIHDKETCDNFLKTGEGPQPFGKICAFSTKGFKSICTGDSGGPLVINGRLVGVASTSSDGCKSKPFPNVFTEVAYFRKWVDEKVTSRNEIDS